MLGAERALARSVTSIRLRSIALLALFWFLLFIRSPFLDPQFPPILEAFGKCVQKYSGYHLQKYPSWRRRKMRETISHGLKAFDWSKKTLRARCSLLGAPKYNMKLFLRGERCGDCRSPSGTIQKSLQNSAQSPFGEGTYTKQTMARTIRYVRLDEATENGVANRLSYVSVGNLGACSREAAQPPE